MTDQVEGKPLPEPLPEPQALHTMLVPLLVKHCPLVPTLVSPVPPFAIANKPVTPPFPLAAKFTAGISEFTRGRKIGAAEAPDAGPARIVFALSLANVAASVPEAVTGDPVTLKMEGNDKLTLVTLPPPGRLAGDQALPLHSRT